MWGKYLKDSGLYNEADSIYKQALANCEYAENEECLKTTILNYCDLLLKRGLYDSAMNLLEEGKFSENDDAVYLRYLLRKAECCSYKGHYNDAMSLFNMVESFHLDDGIRYEATTNKAFLLMDMAVSGCDIEYFKSAESLFISALSFDIGEHNKAIVQSNLAIVEARLGKNEEAVVHIDQAISWLSTNLNYNHQDVRIAIRKKAEIELLLNGTKSALPVFQEYYYKEKGYIIEQFKKMSEQQRLDYWKSRKPLISEVFALENEDPGFLYDVALFRRQVALLGKNDSLSICQKLSCSKTEVAKNLKKREVAIEFVKYESSNCFRYAALLLDGSSRGDVRFIPLWSEDSIRLYDIGGKHLDLALCSGVAEDKNKVYQNDLLSSFVWDKLLPYIPEGSTVYFAPDGFLQLLAIEYLPSVNNGKYDFHRLTSTALLAEPRKKTKRQSSQSLIIGGMDYDYIPPLDEWNISSRPNHDAYNYLSQNGITMFFDYLAGTKDETEIISDQLVNTNVFDDIDESVLKEIMENYNIVHLATHGYSWFIDVPYIHYFCRDSITEDRLLLASGIALSGANSLYTDRSRDDGLLSARELCELNLNDVELVVLSSCQSAQGRVSDEGPAGLVRGLKKAGARSIIASLWPVDDIGTLYLMQFFYDEWRKGAGKDGKGCTKTMALQKAQNRMINMERPPIKVRRYNSSKKRNYYELQKATYNAPYYWAPFIIIDDI